MAHPSLTEDIRETLLVFEATGDPGEPLTTTDVTDQLDIPEREGAAQLEELVDRGFLSMKTVGQNQTLWWRSADHLPETGRSFSAVVENVPGMIYRCYNEEGWPMEFVSEGARELTGYDPEALMGGRISFGEDIIHPDDVDHVRARVREGLDHDGSFTIQYRIHTVEENTRWVWERGRAVGTTAHDTRILEGLITDITELKTEARHLKREIDDVFERVEDAFYALDTEFRFTYVNEQAEQLLQRTEADLLGETVWDAFPPVRETVAWESFQEALETQRATEFEFFYEPLAFWVEATVHPSDSGLSVYFRDITDRKERERKLRMERDRFNALFESVPEAVVHVSFQNGEPIVRNINSEFESVFGYSEQELAGRSLNEVIVPDRFQNEAERLDQATRTLERKEAEVRRQTTDGEREFLFRGVPFETEDEPQEGIGVYLDITDRKERERELERYETLLEESSDVNAVLEPDGTFTYITPSVTHVLGYDPDELVGEDAFEYIHPEDRESTQRQFDEAVEGKATRPVAEYRFRHADGSWRWLEARGRNRLDEPEIDGIVLYTRDVTDRVHRKRELKRQREQLATLNDFNGVVRKITDAVIEESTRQEIEEAVCQELVASDSYEFAWIADVDPHTETITSRVEVDAEEFLSEAELSADPDEPIGQGPTGTAFRTGELQVSRDVFTDPDFQPWRDTAEKLGFRSFAAIPVVHGDTLYGVLGVHSAREGAFAEDERRIVGQLGEVIGHAINAYERKQALMSDDAVELEFLAHDVFSDFDGPEVGDGRVTFDRTIHLDEDEFLVYGTATNEAFGLFEALADRLDHFADLGTVSKTGDAVRYEARLDEPPVLSVVAAHGGRVQTASIESGDYRLIVELPPGVGVNRIVQAVQDAYPTAEVIAQRQITRRDPIPERVRHTLSEKLTDRQRTALESAYWAGFFEWPRESTGEDIAAAMDLAPATFHQHLRAGENKLLDALFAEDTGRE